jgi:hypothetical protein|tara:strand:+ start:537 stop:1088 length:552 start_codon:yes stop_codon:yes gene_type:complete
MEIPKNQIFIFDDVISETLCDELIKIINEEATKEEKWGKGSNVQCKGIMATCIKESEKYDKILFDILHEKILELHKCDITITGDCGYNLRKISGATRQHKDGMVGNQDHKEVKTLELRTMSIVIALNSDYQGGEFSFPEQNFMIKLKRGQMLAFPPYWTHPHFTNALMDDTYRYTINTWLYGK